MTMFKEYGVYRDPDAEERRSALLKWSMGGLLLAGGAALLLRGRSAAVTKQFTTEILEQGGKLRYGPSTRAATEAIRRGIQEASERPLSLLESLRYQALKHPFIQKATTVLEETWPGHILSGMVGLRHAVQEAQTPFVVNLSKAVRHPSLRFLSKNVDEELIYIRGAIYGTRSKEVLGKGFKLTRGGFVGATSTEEQFTGTYSKEFSVLFSQAVPELSDFTFQQQVKQHGFWKNLIHGTDYFERSKINQWSTIRERFTGQQSIWEDVRGLGKELWKARAYPGEVSDISLGFMRTAIKLNEQVRQALPFGKYLALGEGAMSSPADFVLNVVFGRVAPLALGAFYLNYLNTKSRDVFGTSPYDVLAEGYKHANLGLAWLKDITGITPFVKRLHSIAPELTSLVAHPFVDQPVGLSRDELEEYYEKGREPVRKGRWWAAMSPELFRGGRIESYQSPWVRRAHEHPREAFFPPSEYYKYASLPTLENLGIPLPHYLDPYHWEKKFYESRPTPLTAPLVESTAFYGPIVNATIGQLIKPVRPMHVNELKEYFNTLAEQNETTRKVRDEDLYGYVTPGGQVQVTQLQPTPTGAGPTKPIPTTSGHVTDQLADINLNIRQAGARAVAPIPEQQGTTPRYVSRERVLDALAQANEGTRSGRVLDEGVLENLRPLSEVTDINQLTPDIIDQLIHPAGIGVQFAREQESIADIFGLRGYIGKTLVGNKTLEQYRLAQPEYTSLERYLYRDLNIGGFSPDLPVMGELSEIFRRALSRRGYEERAKEINPLLNTQPSWLPGTGSIEPDYFINFHRADPYSALPRGEARLPGPGYASIHGLPQDISMEQYPLMDRLEILADVAPYSKTFKSYLDYATHVLEPTGLQGQDRINIENARTRIAAIRKEVAKRKKRYNFAPYRFRYAGDVEEHTLTVKSIIDSQTILTEELANPIRLAGIRAAIGKDKEGLQALEITQQFAPIGGKIKVILNKDPLIQVADDTLQTMHAVVFDEQGRKLQQALLDAGVAKEKVTDYSPTGIQARFSGMEIGLGKSLEWFSHMTIPIPIVGTIKQKFLQTDSALEYYRRRMVYGANFYNWTNPLGIIGQAIQGWAAESPIHGLIGGATLGLFLGRTGPVAAKYLEQRTLSTLERWYVRMGRSKGVLGAIGGIAGLSYSLYLKATHAIPGKLQHRRDTEEYFDILRYMKYQRLYGAAISNIKDTTGIDVDRLLNLLEGQGEARKNEQRRLTSHKRHFLRRGLHGSHLLELLKTERELQQLTAKSEKTKEDKHHIKQLRKIRKRIASKDKHLREHISRKYTKRLGDLSKETQVIPLTEEIARAIQYRDLAKTTLYGVDPHGAMLDIFRAIPSREREFMVEFMKAPPKERSEILNLVPHNMRRVLEAKWRMPIEDRPDLEEYFKNHFLPPPDWHGWSPDANLEDYKIKVMKNEGLDMAEMGYYGPRVEAAERQGVLDIQPFVPRDGGHLKDYLHHILGGQGLENLFITVEDTPSENPDIQIDMRVKHEREDQIREFIRKDGHMLLR